MAAPQDERPCSKCKIMKPTAAFGRKTDGGRSDHLNSWCRLCCTEAQKARYRKDPEKQKAYRAHRGKNPEYIAAKKISDAQWRKDNRERHNASNREWRRSHPEYYAVFFSTRRARKRLNGIGDTAVMADFRKRAASLRRALCYWCHEPIQKGDLHIDHIISIDKYGPDAEWNLCISCSSCNHKKSNKDPSEFGKQHELHLVPEGTGTPLPPAKKRIGLSRLVIAIKDSQGKAAYLHRSNFDDPKKYVNHPAIRWDPDINKARVWHYRKPAERWIAEHAAEAVIVDARVEPEWKGRTL